MIARTLALALLMLSARLSFAQDQPARKPLKVFILAGQSNMEGQAVVDLDGKDYNEGKGTLTALLADPAKAPMFAHLRNADGTWAVRDDVWVRYQRENQPLLAGPLAVGFTPYGDAHHFGPELQFGHVIGNAVDSPVLLVKTAWGGKSLYADFRPPSAPGDTGPYYTLMITQVREALANVRTDFPAITADGCELAGFVWYHGWNDGCDPQHAVPEYETNLVTLIKDVRADLNAPALPVVIGELTGPWVHAEDEWNALRKAQERAAARPEFAGNVLFVPTHDFVRKAEDSPNPGHGHHEFGNAETYFLVGDALGKGMARLLAGEAAPATPAPTGLRGVELEEVSGAEALRVTAITPGSTDAGPLRIGDVILGVKNRKFANAPRAEFDEAVEATRAAEHDHTLRMLHSRDGVERAIDFSVEPPPPDLTKGETRTDDNEWNLGPTGAKGWIFCRGFDTGASRQILITAVEPGSPAQRVLEVGDVLTGVNGRPFESDARVAFGLAIGDAERPASAGCLTVTRWRAGEVKPATIQLPMLGSYSDSAPYDCDKSMRIVESGCRAIAERGLTVRPHDIKRDDWQPPIPTTIDALALLASEDPRYTEMVREYARTIAPADLTLELQPGLYTWSWGYANLFACEYYLATRDESVLPAIRAYSGAIARGQSLVGTWGHGFRIQGEHGTLGGYGAVNQTGLICWMSLALARRCGVDDAEVKHAVELSRTFFRFYTGKGSVPYGDHPPYWLHDDNGKSSSAAITFAVLGDRADAEFFSRMAVAAYGEKELGHTGNYFGYLWGALAANLSGPGAVAAFMKEQRWYYDLARRWDGSWFTNKRDNYEWDMTGLFVLHHALPIRSLVITGKDVDGCAPLEGERLARVIASGREFPLGRTDDACTFMSTEELLRDLGDWSPTRRQRAAEALTDRRDDAVMPALLAMLSADGLDGKLGACLALQYMENRAAPATDALISLLDDDRAWVRIRAAFALASIGEPAMKAVPRLLELCNAVNPADPRGIEAKYISFALFRADFIDQVPKKRGLLAGSLKDVDKDLAYPAIRRMLTCDDGLGTMSVQSIFSTLSDEELVPLLPSIIHATRETPASGEMFAHEIRERAMRYLAEKKIDAGLTVIMDYVSTQDGWGNRTRQVLPLLVNYSARAPEFLPALRALRDRWAANDPDADKPTRASVADEAIAAIEAAAK